MSDEYRAFFPQIVLKLKLRQADNWECATQHSPFFVCMLELYLAVATAWLKGDIQRIAPSP